MSPTSAPHGFTFQLLDSMNTTAIRSTMSVVAFYNLNGTEIFCENGIQQDATAVQNTTVMLFGEPYTLQCA